MDRSSRQKINKEMQALNDTLDELDLTDIYRVFHLKAAEYTFLIAHGTLFRTYHTLCHKFRKTGIILTIFFDHSAIRLGINYREKSIQIYGE